MRQSVDVSDIPSDILKHLLQTGVITKRTRCGEVYHEISPYHWEYFKHGVNLHDHGFDVEQFFEEFYRYLKLTNLPQNSFHKLLIRVKHGAEWRKANKTRELPRLHTNYLFRFTILSHATTRRDLIHIGELPIPKMRSDILLNFQLTPELVEETARHLAYYTVQFFDSTMQRSVLLSIKQWYVDAKTVTGLSISERQRLALLFKL